MCASVDSRSGGIFHAWLAAILLMVAGCSADVLSSVPEHAIGRWQTDARGYERSYLTIGAETITIGMGKFVLVAYPIERIEYARSSNGHDAYALHYTAQEGYADELELSFDPNDLTRMRVDGRPSYWVRSP